MAKKSNVFGNAPPLLPESAVRLEAEGPCRECEGSVLRSRLLHAVLPQTLHRMRAADGAEARTATAVRAPEIVERIRGMTSQQAPEQKLLSIDDVIKESFPAA